MPSATGRPAVHVGDFDGTGGIPRRRPMRESAAGTYARTLLLDSARGGGLTTGGAEGRHRVVAEADRAVPGSGAARHVPGRTALLTAACTGDPFAPLPRVPTERRRVPCHGPACGDAAPFRTATGRGGPLAVAGGRIAGLWYPYGHRGSFGVGGRQRAESRAHLARVMPDPARGIPLVADAARTGVGRTGALPTAGPGGVAPDVMVMPEAIDGSLPPAAVVHRDALDVRQPGSPTGSCRGDRPATAAGVAPLCCARRNGPAERALPPGARMPGRPRYPDAAPARGLRPLPGREPCRPHAAPGRRGLPHTGPRRAPAAPRAAPDRGPIAEPGGRDGGVSWLPPPLTLTQDMPEAVPDRPAAALAAATAARV
ncbi:aspartate aminotransferase family protein [Streptomyces sp. NPDC026673]|uniref:aspartate aminotransferase family protein n=1 Tax=Streptomyces sp. NPDC026673 TaxID=3155724 RepID=UPI0033E720ED